MSLVAAGPADLGAEALQECIVQGLANSGLAIIDDFLPPARVAELAAEAREFWTSGDFQDAGIGQGEHFQHNATIRTDRIRWLNPAAATPAQRHFLATLEGLRLAINRALFLGLFEFEGHFALYPAGAYYRKHLDQFRDADQRVVTLILYLNAAWREEDGGQLRIYTDPADENRQEQVLPIAGRLVCFLSDRFVHEVLPARRERLSLTGWFRKRDRLMGAR